MPAGNLSSSTETRTRGGSAGSPGASSQPDRLSAARCSTVSTVAANSATTGRSSRGAATQSARAQTSAQPSVAASANQPSARPALPAAEREARSAPSRRRCTGTRAHSQRRAEREPGGDAAAEADHEPRRKLRALRLEEPFQRLASRGNPRLPIAPSTLWKRRFPYVRGARPLHCSMERRGKRA